MPDRKSKRLEDIASEKHQEKHLSSDEFNEKTNLMYKSILNFSASQFGLVSAQMNSVLRKVTSEHYSNLNQSVTDDLTLVDTLVGDYNRFLARSHSMPQELREEISGLYEPSTKESDARRITSEVVSSRFTQEAYSLIGTLAIMKAKIRDRQDGYVRVDSELQDDLTNLQAALFNYLAIIRYANELLDVNLAKHDDHHYFYRASNRNLTDITSNSKVIIVDKEDSWREVLVDILGMHDMSAIPAENKRETLKEFITHAYGLESGEINVVEDEGVTVYNYHRHRIGDATALKQKLNADKKHYSPASIGAVVMDLPAERNSEEIELLKELRTFDPGLPIIIRNLMPIGRESNNLDKKKNKINQLISDDGIYSFQSKEGDLAQFCDVIAYASGKKKI